MESLSWDPLQWEHKNTAFALSIVIKPDFIEVTDTTSETDKNHVINYIALS